MAESEYVLALMRYKREIEDQMKLNWTFDLVSKRSQVERKLQQTNQGRANGAH